MKISQGILPLTKPKSLEENNRKYLFQNKNQIELKLCVNTNQFDLSWLKGFTLKVLNKPSLKLKNLNILRYTLNDTLNEKQSSRGVLLKGCSKKVLSESLF